MKAGTGCLISLLGFAAIFAVLVLLSGCANLDAVKRGVAAYGASAADSALESAKWGNCEAATVGAVKRRYINDAEGLLHWQQYCGWPVH